MTTLPSLREAATRALEALEYIHSETSEYEDKVIGEAITALKAALAEPTVPSDCTDSHQPVQEPVATCDWPQCGKTWPSGFCKCVPDTAPLNLNDPAVQKRLAAQWGYVKAAPPLTDDEIAQVMYRADAIVTGPMQFRFARAIERAHGIGGEDD